MPSSPPPPNLEMIAIPCQRNLHFFIQFFPPPAPTHPRNYFFFIHFLQTILEVSKLQFYKCQTFTILQVSKIFTILQVSKFYNFQVSLNHRVNACPCSFSGQRLSSSSPAHPQFSNFYTFLVHHLVNRDDRRLLAQGY
jgi:hypothetical protein